ncbi:MAG: hypothetical protein RM338_24320, partial [Nostoc sp. DedQUE12a]|nr:hypothetical protein [Nostoc sp. DedQUE12a]
MPKFFVVRASCPLTLKDGQDAIGVNLTSNPCKDVIFSYLTSHQDPRYPTPVLSKAKTAPPQGIGEELG